MNYKTLQNLRKFSPVLTFVYVLGLIVLSIGWFMNIHRLMQCDFSAPFGEEVLRIIGVFIFLLGSILGYIQM